MSTQQIENVEISPNFNSSDADVILISSDSVEFHVYKRNLIWGSSVFRDMFEIGSNENNKPRIPIEESSTTLEIGLPYFSPELVNPISIHDFENMINFFDKYDATRKIVREAHEYSYPHQIIYACIFSAQTKDIELNRKALEALFKMKMSEVLDRIQSKSYAPRYDQEREALLNTVSLKLARFSLARSDLIDKAIRSAGHHMKRVCDEVVGKQVLLAFIENSKFEKLNPHGAVEIDTACKGRNQEYKNGMRSLQKLL